MDVAAAYKPLAKSLVERGYATFDPLQLGFAVSTSCEMQDESGMPSALLYSIGPPTKGTFWESVAVPEIRKHGFKLVKQLLHNIFKE